MRQIKYILINDTYHKTLSGAPVRYDVTNFGHHYIINRAGTVLNPIDVCEPGSFLEHETRNLEPRARERLSQCSIGIKFNGSLEAGTLNLELRAKLIRLLLDLRHRYPDAKILALDELIPETRNLKHGTHGCIHVRDDMNQLRRELSNLT